MDYLTETGGEAFWTETQTVQITEGLFNVVLGSMTSFEESTMEIMPDSVFLKIQVGSDPPMTPRKQFMTVPYAFKADDSAQLGGHKAENYIRTINGVGPSGGDVELVAGNNVTIYLNPDGHQIRISATGSAGSDNLGNHKAEQNIVLGSHWLSRDGGNEGISFMNNDYLSISNPLTCKSSIVASSHIQSNRMLIGKEGVYASGGIIQSGTPSSAYSDGDIVADDDLLADDDVVAGDRIESKGDMLCRGFSAPIKNDTTKR